MNTIMSQLAGLLSSLTAASVECFVTPWPHKDGVYRLTVVSDDGEEAVLISRKEGGGFQWREDSCVPSDEMAQGCAPTFLEVERQILEYFKVYASELEVTRAFRQVLQGYLEDLRETVRDMEAALENDTLKIPVPCVLISKVITDDAKRQEFIANKIPETGAWIDFVTEHGI